ncbi:hypothetical protein GQ457_08G028340 [Hibiscus cannabinus]
MQIASSGRQGSKGDRVKPLFKYAQISAILVSSIGTLSGYRYPNPTLEFGYRYLLGRVSVPLVSIPASKGIDTPLDTPLGIGTKGGVSVPRPMWDLSIDTGFRVPIPAA